MMCSTTAVQVCVDAGEGARRRPALGRAARAGARRCSPRSPTRRWSTAAAPAGSRRAWRAGWRSTPSAPRPPPSLGADPGREYARRALDTHLLCVRRDGAGGVSWEAPDVTFAQWIDGALDTAPTLRRPRLPPDHALPARAPAGPPRGPLPRPAGRRRVGGPAGRRRRADARPRHRGARPRRGRARRRPLDRRRPPRARRPRPAPGRGRASSRRPTARSPGPRSPTSTPTSATWSTT